MYWVPKKGIALSKGRKGSISVAISSVKLDNWLARPKNEGKSVTFVEQGKSAMALVMLGSIWYPSAQTVNPPNFASWFGKFKVWSVHCDYIIHTKLQDFPHVRFMSFICIIIKDTVICNAPHALRASLGPHLCIYYSVRKYNKFQMGPIKNTPPKWGDESGQCLAFRCLWHLPIAI